MRPRWTRLAQTRGSGRWIELMLLLAVFAGALTGLDRASLWGDEAWSIWVAQASWPLLLQQVALDVHPPLYFVLLKPWVNLTGESVYAARLLATMFGLVGLAICAALGRWLRDQWLGIVALLWLGTHGFLLYYLREVRMYSLLFALAALATWLYGQWLRRPAWAWWTAYVVMVVALAYTHYFGLLVIAAHGLHLAVKAPRRLLSWLAASGLGLLLFAPWLPTLIAQIAAHPAGPHQTTAATDWATGRHLIWVLTGGAGFWVLAPWLWRGPPRPDREGWGWLVLIGCVLPPLAMLAANAALTPIYEPRNVIGALPALALLVAAGVRQVRRPLLACGLALLLVIANLAAWSSLRPPKPAWAAAFDELRQHREPTTPLLVQIVEPSSVEAYYARVLPLRNATTYDLPIQPMAPATLQTLVGDLPATAPVWVVTPHNTASSWQALAELGRTRQVEHRHQVEYLLFYRFGPAVQTDGEMHWQFTFGDRLRYTSKQIAMTYTVQPGEPLCLATPLTVLRPLAGEYSFGLHLVDGSGRLATQVDGGLADPPPGATLPLSTCLALPATVQPGRYALHLLVYQRPEGRRLPVLEAGVAWGDALVVAVVEVGRPPLGAVLGLKVEQSKASTILTSKAGGITPLPR